MLEENEWLKVSPILDNMVLKIKEYRDVNKCGLKEAQLAVGKQALDIYSEITGISETNYLALYHHRLSLFGNECANCKHLLRTPKAKYCANCGKECESIAKSKDAEHER